MPSTSKAQQRLMGMAYALKSGEMDPKDASQEVKDLADSMTLKQLKDFASTKHEGLPDHVEEDATGISTPTNTPGMGDVSLPGNPGSSTSFASQKVGSGDSPFPMKKNKNKKRKMKLVERFEDFITDNRSVAIDESIEITEDMVGKLEKVFNCKFEIGRDSLGGAQTIVYTYYELMLVRSSSGWSLGKYFNKKDADEVAKYVNSNEVSCIVGDSKAVVEKGRTESIYSYNIEGLLKAAGIKI
jgi:hypothetical protein